MPVNEEPTNDLQANWTHAGRLTRGVVHEVNNQLGAILAYSELVAAAQVEQSDARRMLVEIGKSARECSAQLDTLSAVVSRDLTSVETIRLDDLLRRVATLFRYDLERDGRGPVLIFACDACMFAGVRSRVVCALIHSIRHAADRVSMSRVPGRVQVRLTSDAAAYRVEVESMSLESLSRTEEFPVALIDAREHLRYHHGELFWEPEGRAVLTVPRQTGLVSDAPGA